MKNQDLFVEYLKKRSELENARESRGNTRGILMAKDEIALRYQGLYYEVHALQQKLMCRMNPQMVEFYKERNVCATCGYPPSGCSCAGGHKPVENWEEEYLGPEVMALKSLLFELMWPSGDPDEEISYIGHHLKALAEMAGMQKEVEEWLEQPLPF